MDIEASGFGPDSYPIEVGVVLENQRTYCSLIRPEVNWNHWSDEAEQVHGISRKCLLDYGKSIVQVINDLNQLLDNKTVYSDGWVVDHSWMIRLYSEAGQQQSFRLSPLENILNEQQMSIWHSTKEKVISDLNLQRHRASSDALIIQKTYALSRQKAVPSI